MPTKTFILGLLISTRYAKQKYVLLYGMFLMESREFYNKRKQFVC